MDAALEKAVEATAQPPSYEESTSNTQNMHNQAIQNGNTVNIPSNGGTNYASTGVNSTPLPMFITARTSVFGACPVEMDCPYCQAHIVTHIDRVAGMLPWIIMGVCIILGFFLFGLPWCFCCIPFCIDSCLDVVHSCPACKRHLGRYSRM